LRTIPSIHQLAGFVKEMGEGIAVGKQKRQSGARRTCLSLAWWRDQKKKSSLRLEIGRALHMALADHNALGGNEGG